MTANKPHEDWHFGTPGVLVVGSLLAVLATAAFPYGWFPAPAPAGLAVVGATLTVLLHRRHGRAVAVFRASCWLSLGAWATAVCLLGWSWLIVALLVAAILAMAMVAPLFSTNTEPTPSVLLRSSVAAEWKARIDRICAVPAPGVVITNKADWEGKTGYTLTIEGPEGFGFTFQNLQDNMVALSAAARLKPGCIPAAFEGEEHQGQAMLNVPTVYDLATVVAYPSDYSPLTVNGDIPLGSFPNRTTATIDVRESSALIVGMKGGGKTNLMDIITADLARCPDALIWHLDMNGGGMALNWLGPWLNNANHPELEVPAIDWVAHDEDEAVFMSQAALAIVKARKAAYLEAARSANSRLVPMTPAVPEIFIMVDEAAEVLGDQCRSFDVNQNISAVMRMGRAVGVNVILSSLRATGDHIPVQIRKGCANRIGMKVQESCEYEYLFENSRGLRPHMLKLKGEAFLFSSEKGNSIQKFRTYDLKPDQIAEISIAVQHRRPELDARSAQAAGKSYSDRGARCNDFLLSLVEGSQGDDVVVERVVDAVAHHADDEVAWLDDLFNAPAAEPVRPHGTTIFLSDGAKLVVEIVVEPMRMADIRLAVESRGRDVQRQTVAEWAKEAVLAGALEKGTKQGLYQPVGWSAPEENG